MRGAVEQSVGMLVTRRHPASASRPPRGAIGCLAALLILVFAGCGSDDSGSAASNAGADTTSSPVELDSTATEESEPVEEAAFTPERTYTWEVEAESGSEGTFTLEVGEIVDADDSVPGFRAMETACETDYQRDAFLPIRMDYLNRTHDFEAEPNVKLRVKNIETTQGPITMDAATVYGDGPDCNALTTGSMDDGANVTFDPIAPQERGSHEFLIVLHNFRTPAYPEGDQEELRNFFGTLSVTEENSPFRAQCFTAPANRYVYVGGLLGLSGALSPGLPLSNEFDVERGEKPQGAPPRC